jgi:hypothetical protein
MRFRLHARCGEHRHPAFARGLLSHGQQPRLADARLTAKHERLPALSNLVQE